MTVVPNAQHEAKSAAPRPTRIVLVRHGKPAIDTNPCICHAGFRRYIGDYQGAGLDPTSLPPRELRAVVSGSRAVFTSMAPRAADSARMLLPNAELIADPLFEEAPLAAPRIPLLKMRVPAWAVIARILWHVGYHPGIEDYRRAKARALRAVDVLMKRTHRDEAAVLVAHGYFNAMIGRVLRQHGFSRRGVHRAHFWNAVVYERA